MLSTRALNRALLARQLLLARAPLSPLAAIEQLAGMQAQLPRPPFVGLWTRLAEFRHADLTALVHARTVVRGTLMRGTLHLVSARDYLALRATLQPLLSAAMASILRDRAAGMNLAAVTKFARTKLPASFDELRPHLVAKFPQYDERALGFAVRMHLPLVMVPDESERHGYPAKAAFAPADAYLGAAPAKAAAEAALVRRYLAAFGPATPRDAQAWSGLDLRAAFTALRRSLVVLEDERGRELFDLPDAPRPDADTPAPVRFVPDFDNLVLGHHDRSRIITDAHRKTLVTKNGQVKATFLVDGMVAGTWTLARTARTATLSLAPYAKLARPIRTALEAEGLALLRFTDADAPSHAVRFLAP